MIALRKRHQSTAGKTLKIIVKTLKESTKKEFYLRLHHWKIQYQDFLNGRSDKPNEKAYFSYKHQNVKSAYTSIRRYFDYLFTYENHAEFNIEKTTNRIEGLFSELKRSLIAHNGLTKKHKIMFIKDFLNKKSC